MKHVLLLLGLTFLFQTSMFSQCVNIDTDNDGVIDCIDPCPNVASSKIGNLSFESDFIGWTIPQNTTSFGINNVQNNTLHGSKALYVSAPNSSNFESHAIYTEEFTLEEGVAYNFKIPVKRIGNLDGDAMRWVLIDENGIYRHFNNYYDFTENWSYIEFNNFLVNFNFYTSNKFRLRLEFGLSSTDMVVDKIEFYETALLEAPAYKDLNGDGIADCTPFSSANHPDYDALVSLYNGLNGINWTNNTNWLDTSKPLSSWYGITETNGRVTGINLAQNNLSGVIPERIDQLSALNTLILNTNSIVGTIPITLTNLSNLSVLILAVNNITGGIPVELGNMVSLTQLHLGDNPLGNAIPTSIGNLTNLSYLDLRACNLSGEIPSELGNLTKLNSLFLFLNNLNGTIPQSFENLTSLINLQLSFNNLSGNIPDFSNFTGLTYFNISNNKFVFADFEDEYNTYLAKLGNGDFQYSPQKRIDETIGIAASIGETITLNTLPNLGTNTTAYWYKINNLGESEFLGSGNSFDVTIQSEGDYTDYYYLVTSSIITTFSLESNRITVGSPPENHTDYDALIAIYNALDGPNWNTPWDITAPINTWSTLDLSFDNTSNRITRLNLRGNDKIGQLPKEIGDLTTLTSLAIESSENINGTIPPEIGNLSNLVSLYLWHCDLSGEIPTELWSLSNLQSIFIGNQKSNALTFNNGLPIEIANLQNLQLLDLNGIPISGELPNELFGLPNLTYILLNSCELSGQLPEQFANINQVHLAYNNFEGAIPQPILDTTGNLTLNITGNYFDFNDLESLVMANNYPILLYNPQRTKDTEQDLEFAPGEDITLSIDDTRHNKLKDSKGIGDNYQWFKDDVAITGANASSYIITNAQETDSGVYHCEITNNLVPDLIIIRADISLVIDASLSVNENEKNNLSIYPNPTNGIVNIKLNGATKVSAALFNVNGRKIRELHLSNTNTVLDISNLNPGMYLLHLKTNDRSVIKRIIKQ